jgi:hypothetical protein
MWDQKNGKYPWKPGTPIFKCRDKECASNGGVIWEPKNGAAKPFPKAPPAKVAYNTPKALPNEFDGYRQEETAELNAHTGRGVVDDGLGALMAQCVLDSFAAWNSAMAKYSDVGYSGDNVQGSANTLFIARKDRMPRAV